jgi:hypothetical protein
MFRGARGGLEDVYVGRFKDGLSEDDSILEARQVRNTNAALYGWQLFRLSPAGQKKMFCRFDSLKPRGWWCSTVTGNIQVRCFKLAKVSCTLFCSIKYVQVMSQKGEKATSRGVMQVSHQQHLKS